METQRLQPPANETERREIDAIFHHFKSIEGLKPIYHVMDQQLSVIHQRAQSLLQLAGVVITVTGFSGRIIADTNLYAQVMIIFGVCLVALGAAIAIAFVMPVRWLSTYLHLHPEDWLLTAIRRRRKKTRAFRYAMAVMIIGMLFYVAAISIMLFFPESTELRRVR